MTRTTAFGSTIIVPSRDHAGRIVTDMRLGARGRFADGTVTDTATGKAYGFQWANDHGSVGVRLFANGRTFPESQLRAMRDAICRYFQAVDSALGRAALESGWQPAESLVFHEVDHAPCLPWTKGAETVTSARNAIRADAARAEAAARKDRRAALKASPLWFAYARTRRAVPHVPAMIAARRAADLVAQGIAPTIEPSSGPGGLGAPFQVGSTALRWSEEPVAFGLRLVGPADEVAPRRVDHTGWHLDPDGMGENARGAVYQLPARGGRARFVPAILDPHNEGPAMVALGDIITGEPGEDGAESARLDAASRADRLAEIYAEAEREYQTAWRAGSDYAQAQDEVAEHRKSALALCAEIKRVRTVPALSSISLDVICKTLRDHVLSHRADITKLRAEMRNFAIEGRSYNSEAFNEGAGRPVLS